MKIQAIIFDMDGVLIEAKEWHYEALNRALNHFGYNISRYDHLVTFDGLPTKEKLKMLSIEQGLPEALHHFLNTLKQNYTMELVTNRCKPLFHHEFALSRLKQAGYRLGVASNSVRNTVTSMMERSALAPYLDIQLSNEDVANGKPAPDIYLAASKILGVNPSECLVVEDNPKGIESAESAGCHVLVVKSVYEVTHDHIMKRISQIESSCNHSNH